MAVFKGSCWTRLFASLLAWTTLTLTTAGCGDNGGPETKANGIQPYGPAEPIDSTELTSSIDPTASNRSNDSQLVPADPSPRDEIEIAPSGRQTFVSEPELPAVGQTLVDDARAASKGIRKLVGKHLTLYTDLPEAEDVDELPDVFDQAVPQWCSYFGVNLKDVHSWRLHAFLMKEKERFQAAELFPLDLPMFSDGFHRGLDIWMYEQPSVYYRRHLMLHEGTHAFMNLHVGGIGPPWYAEGTAELCGLHVWHDDTLKLRHMPQSREEVPFWGGRIALIQKRFASGQALMLEQVMQFGPTAHAEPEPYAWSWAAAAFFDNHPDYQAAFRAAKQHVSEPPATFNTRLRTTLQQDWLKINEQWQLFISELQYGYDVARAAVVYRPGQPLPNQGAMVTIDADRGWQSTGIRLEADATYQISARGRYQVDDEPKPWWCEPGGVTIRYYQGWPLGMLIGAIRNDEDPFAGRPHLAASGPIGLSRELTTTRSGTLYLRINESPAGLADNSGQLTVHVVAKD